MINYDALKWFSRAAQAHARFMGDRGEALDLWLAVIHLESAACFMGDLPRERALRDKAAWIREFEDGERHVA